MLPSYNAVIAGAFPCRRIIARMPPNRKRPPAERS
jgi:hypothetical protein